MSGSAQNIRGDALALPIADGSVDHTRKGGTEAGVTIIQGNALDLPLADNSVDLVVTSPP